MTQPILILEGLDGHPFKWASYRPAASKNEKQLLVLKI